MHTVTPYLMVDGAAKLIDFLKQAFGAEEYHCSLTAEGRIMHAQVKIGDSPVMIADSSPQYGPMPVMLHLYVPDVDATYAKAVAAGGTSLREPADQFYGDRSGGVRDPFGNQWWISTHVEDVSEEEMARRMKALGR